MPEIIDSARGEPIVKVRKVIIPAAGRGTRFLPATKAIPKEMLPIVDKPLIQYGIEEAARSGASQIILVSAAGKGAMIDHFDRDASLERALEEKNETEKLASIRDIARSVTISSIRQRSRRGLGDAILTARDLVGSEPFGVILPDDLIHSGPDGKAALASLIGQFEKSARSLVALTEIAEEMIPSYGIARVDEGFSDRARLRPIVGLVEKPPIEKAPSNLGIVGRYVFTPTIFDKIAQLKPGANGEIQLTDAMVGLIEEEGLDGVILDGTRYDAGDKFGATRATIEYALRHSEIGAATREYLTSGAWRSIGKK